MAVTVIVEGPRTEVGDFCTALETVLLDSGRYSWTERHPGGENNTHAYLVVEETLTWPILLDGW